MVTGIEDSARKLSLIPTMTSPNIGTLWNFLDLYNTSDPVKHSLPEYVFLNCHECFDVETAIEHTEYNSLCTIIAIPMQSVPSSKNGNFKNGVFQFFTENNEVIKIQMNTGVAF